jgi:hypothetical protein
MESLLQPIELNKDTAAVIDEIRSGAANPLCGAGPDKADAHFAERINPILEDTGMPRILVTQYGWFLRELTKLWRTRTGRDLAFHLELCVRKWLNLGLETRTIQFLICEVFLSLKGQGAAGPEVTTKHAPSPVEGTQSHKEVGQDGLGQEVTTKHAPSAVEGTQSHKEEADNG